MKTKTSITLIFCILSIIAYGQNENFALSGDGRFIGYINEIPQNKVDTAITNKYLSAKNVYELRYYEIATQKAVLKYQFQSWRTPTIQISFDGKTIAIKGDKTHLINALSRTLISSSDNYYGTITFPKFDHCFLSHYTTLKTIDCYDTFTGKKIKTYEGSQTIDGFGEVWFTDDDKYIIQQKSSSKFAIWKVGVEKMMKNVTAKSFHVDYASGKITFATHLKTSTYLLDDMSLVYQSDLKFAIQDYIKQKKTFDKKVQIRFGNGIISNSGNFMIIHFTENTAQSLMLFSTQRDEYRVIPTDKLIDLADIKWLNDSIIIINHKNNSTTFLNLYEYQKTKTIEKTSVDKKQGKNTEITISPSSEFYVAHKKTLFSNNYLLHNVNSSINEKLVINEFVSFSINGNYLFVKEFKTNKLGLINPKDKNLTFIPFHDTIPAIIESENPEENEVYPETFNPNIITAYKHIDEIKDTSALIKLLLRNVEYTDSTISLNAHLIDENGVYYYGASSEKWKHIWCNVVLNSGNKNLKQITDFEIIEHRDNIFLPYGTAIIMDHSGSMGHSRALKLQKAVENYINMKVKDDAFSLIKFDHGVGIESYPTKNTIELLQNLEKIGLNGYGGATSILDAANAGISVLKNYDDYVKNNLVILTDGMENASFIHKVDLIQRALNNNINVFIIGFGEYVDDDYLKSITNNTNGAYYKIYKTSDFDWIFKDIHAKMRNYYEIKFKSDFQGEHQSLLKVCITNKHSDTLGITFNNTPFPKRENVDLEVADNIGKVNTINSDEELNNLSKMENIKDFSKVKSSLYVPEKKSVNKENPTNQLINEDFENLEFSDIQFEFNSTNMVGSSQNIVDQLVSFLQKNKNLKIEIAGHTDSNGDANFNLELSEKRALTIKSKLEEKGIDGNRIKTKGYGDLFPLVPNTSEKNKQKNRRVEFRILN